MWICEKCKRTFQREKQQHTCATKPIEEHFVNKHEAYLLYQKLLKTIGSKVGKIKVLSIPCCIHLFGNYDFMAILPKKDGVLEIRFALGKKLVSKRITACVPLSLKSYKNCLLINSAKDIDSELIK
ncbi:hypothetical protein KJ810_02945, partial [Patescibacteria group bacterium]|nr:hypothetical protein [Patescibacteria group bacterium]